MNLKLCFFISVIQLLFLMVTVFAEQKEKNREVVIFKLDTTGWDIPQPLIEEVDQDILLILQRVRRYKIISMDYKIGEDKLQDFFADIEDFKSGVQKIPDVYEIGKVKIKKQDLNRIINMYIVVLPVVTQYISKEQTEDGMHLASIQADFTLYDIQNNQIIDTLTINTEGMRKNADSAVKSAVKDIAVQFGNLIKTIPEFKIKRDIIEISDQEVIFYQDTDNSITKGEEFLVLYDNDNEEKQVTEEKGLVQVINVSQDIDIVIGKLLYANADIEVGDEMKNTNKLGLDFTPYLHLAQVAGVVEGFYGLGGIRTTLVRGFFPFRFTLGFEVPLMITGEYVFDNMFPTNIYFGGDFNLYFGIIQIAPAFLMCINLSYPQNESGQDVYFYYYGPYINIPVSFLISRDFKICVDIGFSFWFGIERINYYGFVGGMGFCFKL